MEIQHVPVSGAGIPQPPQGAIVHQRGVTPPPTPEAPQLQQPQFQPQVPQLEPAAPAAQAPDQTLLSLLAALSTRQEPAQPTAAPVPAQPTQAPDAGQDPVIAALQSTITSSGLDYERALGRAMAEGDATLIDFAYIAEKGGAQAQHLRQVAEGLVAHQEAIDNRLEQGVYAKFGGENNWDAAIAFFAKSVPKTTTDYVVQMLKTRNPALIEQASNIVMDHVKQAGAHLAPANLVTGAGGGQAAQPLGKDEFKQAIAKLNTMSPTYEAERKQLFARRAQGKYLGR